MFLTFLIAILASVIGTVAGILIFAASFEIWNTKLKKIVKKNWPK
jgi:hypothetical protein|tara:strand:- start:4754 stop:4888 length:135 start_codon:yes stop_codon:yes gene_type:complete